MSTLRPPRHDLRLLAGSLAVTVIGVSLVSACGTVEPKGTRQPFDLAISSGDEVADAGAPTGCEDASPAAAGSTDLADVTTVPSDWPTPPVPALLCGISGPTDGRHESATYATPAAPATVLDQYEAALPASYEVTRQDGVDGDLLEGRAGAVSFRVEAHAGAYSLTFARG